MNLPPLPKQPLVSIVTPSYNQAAFLEQALISVLEQNYLRLEYIVVDGASTDGSVDIIRKYADKLTFWVSEKDGGQAEAINKGFSRAKGEIFAWLNSDDYYLPGTISAAVKVFREHPDLVLIYGNLLAVNEHSQTTNLLHYGQLTLEDLLCFQIIGQPAVFFRREAFEITGGLDTSYHCFLDHHLWLRMALQGRILHVDQTWAAARFHPAAKNRARSAEFSREAFRLFDWAKDHPELSPILARAPRPARASLHRVDARYMLDGGQPWKSLGAWFRALFIHPPTALARMNILASALLYLTGFGRLHAMYLERRQTRLRQR